jgi:hypothetical protein
MMCSVAYTGAATTLLLMPASGTPLASLTAATSSTQTIEKKIADMDVLSTAFSSIAAPNLAEPQWLKDKKAAEAAAARKAAVATTIVTYDVSTKGMIRADVAEFRVQANQTLNDARGWSRLGVSFQEVASGGMFTLVLSEASQMTSFSPGCGTEYSCRAGRYVIINQDRWLGATTSWNNAGGSLRDYRHMVVNHETGHWLGHDHEQCSGAGQPAPVMQQQSINLQGCKFNPWPKTSELWSTQLGISKQ